MYLWWGMEGGMRGMRLVSWKKDWVLFFSLKIKGSLKTISISHQKVNWSVSLTEWEQISRKMTSMLMKSERNFSLPPVNVTVCFAYAVGQYVKCVDHTLMLPLFLRTFHINFKYLITWKTKTLCLMKVATFPKTFKLTAQITVYPLIKQMQPVLSMVWTIPGNATSKKQPPTPASHAHHGCRLASLQSPSFFFFFFYNPGTFWWGAKCLIKGEIKLLK